MKLAIAIIISTLCLVGCGTTETKQEAPKDTEKKTTEIERERDFSEKGTVTKEVVTVNNKIRSELHRVLDGVVFEGKATFKDKNREVARNAALTLAINDMAKRAGAVLIEEDTTVTNDQVTSIVRTRASNIVAGYAIMVDTYDPETQIAEIVVRQEGERIASEMARIVIEE